MKLSAKPVPFHRKDTTTKQRHILGFFVEEKDIEEVFRVSGMLLGQESVETIPENIPSAALDSHVDVNIIRKFFDGDGWMALTAAMEERRQLPWFCHSCQDTLEGQSIGCDSCLNWQHWSCAAVKGQPKSKFWYCKDCKC